MSPETPWGRLARRGEPPDRRLFRGGVGPEGHRVSPGRVWGTSVAASLVDLYVTPTSTGALLGAWRVNDASGSLLQTSANQAKSLGLVERSLNLRDCPEPQVGPHRSARARWCRASHGPWTRGAPAGVMELGRVRPREPRAEGRVHVSLLGRVPLEEVRVQVAGRGSGLVGVPAPCA